MTRAAKLVAAVVMSCAALADFLAPRARAQALLNPQVTAHFRAGQQDMRAGKALDAVAEFQQVLRLAPNLDEARINLGLAYHLLGDYTHAAAELEDGLRRQPNLPGPNLVLGIDELKLGVPAKAVPALTRAFKLDPSNEQAGSNLADAYLALGDYARAGRTYRAAIKANTPGSWLGLGKAYLSMSSRLTARVASEFAGTVWAARLAGDFLAERGALREAAERYRRALSRHSQEPGVRVSLGNLLLRQGNIDGAAREFQSALRLDPASVQALLGISQIELAGGHSKKALEDVSKIAQRSPEFLQTNLLSLATMPPASAASLVRELAGNEAEPGGHLLLAALFTSAGDRAAAERERDAAELDLARLAGGRKASEAACKAHDYARCIVFLNRKPRLEFSQDLALGEALFALHRDDAASDAFASAVDREKNNPEALYWLVRADSAVAGDCFTRLAAEFPESGEARELEAETYRARGEDDKAIAQYQVAAALQPENAEVDEALGALYLKQHRLTEAEGELTKSLKLDPTDAETLYELGRVNIGLERPEIAIAYLRRALRYNPSLLRARASLGIALVRAGKPALAVPEIERAQSLDVYGDLHYTLYQAYRQLGKTAQAQSALAVSQSLRKKTEARDQALIQASGASADER